jgi:hypothetical protein
MRQQVKAHDVFAIKIVGVLPLTSQNGNLVSPEAGLVLLLEDRSRHKWLMEHGGVTPSIGDYLVRDEMLHTDYIVGAETYSQLFEALVN